MQASIKLTELVKKLCARYHVEWWQARACLRLVMPEVEHYLQIENLGNERISVGLYFDFEGRHMPEMEIVLWSGFQPEPIDVEVDTPWAAIEYTSVYDTWKLFVELDRSGAVICCHDPVGQSKLCLMANDWSDELERQGWLSDEVWLSRCTECLDTQEMWERDIVSLFNFEDINVPFADSQLMPDSDEEGWLIREIASGSRDSSYLWIEEDEMEMADSLDCEELLYGSALL